ncbi:MAG: 50S ribosomal protein L25 [Acidobacteria bacterium]|nr:50S ribosomal protein L25 [Acidobacteriota bacterium]
MKEIREIEVEERGRLGRSGARVLRRQGLLPGIVYGGGRPVVPIAIDPRRVQAILQSESGMNTILLLRLRGKDAKRHVMIRDYQRDPVTSRLVHADFVRILMDEKVEVSVRVQLQGTAEGVRIQEGVLDFVLREIRVSCLPAEIPESIQAEVTSLKLGDSLLVADLPRGEGVQFLTPLDQVVVVVSPPIKEEVVPEAAAVEGPREPEVIQKGKAAAEGEEPAPEREGKKPEPEGKKPEREGKKPEREAKKPKHEGKKEDRG